MPRATLRTIRTAVAAGLLMLTSACVENSLADPPVVQTDSAQVTVGTVSPPSTTTAASTFEPTSSVAAPPPTAEPDELFRLAPKSPSILTTRGFDKTTSYFSGHTNTYFDSSPGSFMEIVDLYLVGLAYQNSVETNIIWLNPEDPRELLVATGSQTLELEGGYPTGDDAGVGSVIYYQRHSNGAGGDQISTLRRYDVGTEEVIEIARTGGEGWQTEFSYLADGDTALALVSSDSPGMFLVDLETDRGADVRDLPPVCPQLAATGRLYDHATVVDDGQILGVRAIFNTHDGVVDSKGFFLLDPVSCDEDLIAQFPFDNDWYVENMVGYLISLRTAPDETGEPLPALGLRGEGGSITAPDAMYLRPGYVS